MARFLLLPSRFRRGGIVLLLGLVVLVGCGTPVGTPTGVSRAGVAASPTVARPGPGTPVGTPGTPVVGAAQGTPTIVPATPTIAATVPPVANPALLAMLRDVQALKIEEGWWAYGPIQDMKMAFEFRRTGDGLVGTGSYAETSYSGLKSATTREIAIPESAILAFAVQLADAPLREGPYELGPKASDYYPVVRIEFTTPAGTVVFRSESQKQDYAPWQVTFGGKSYVIDGPHPAIALKGLDPYLRRDETLKSLTAAIDATKMALPTATRATPPPCRAPVAGQPTPVAPPSPDPAAARVAPGAQPKVGEVINLAQYFALPGSTFLSASGSFAPMSVSDRARIAGFVAALDREATVLAYSSPFPSGDVILFTFDVNGKPVGFGYSAERGIVAFSVAAQSYVVAAPPSFRGLWSELICPGSGR